MESKGFPPENIITTLAGDFLGPSLLSSLDQGKGMIDCMNKVGPRHRPPRYPRFVHSFLEVNGILRRE